MSRNSVKALVLAAGFGTRLRPLTDVVPKPLSSILGVSLLELALWRIAQVGITSVAVNTHYHAEKITSLLRKKPLGFDPHVSHEPEILGTGGVYNPLKSWLGKDDLLVVNGDIVSDMNLSDLVDRHFEAKSLATMMVLEEVIPGESGVNCSKNEVLSIGPTHKGTVARNFACAQVLSREFIDQLPGKGSFDIMSQGYQPRLKEGEPISCLIHRGLWHDIRNPNCYFEALKDILTRSMHTSLGIEEILTSRHESFTIQGSSFINSGAKIGNDVVIGPNVVIETGVTIGANAKIENSILIEGAAISSGELVKNLIVSSNLRVDLSAS